MLEGRQHSKKINLNTNANKIYNDAYVGKKLISIDVKQANASFIFVYLGQLLYGEKNVKDMGLDLESFFSTMEDMKLNFNWSYYVKAKMNKLSILRESKLFRITSDETFHALCSVFETSKIVRQIIIGAMGNNKPPGCEICLRTIFETACKNTLSRLINSLETLIKQNNAKIISFSMDEIIIDGMNHEELLNFLRTSPLGKNSYIAEKYLKVDEFILKKYNLNSKKRFFVKYFTNNNIPSFKQLDPETKLECLELVMDDQK